MLTGQRVDVDGGWWLCHGHIPSLLQRLASAARACGAVGLVQAQPHGQTATSWKSAGRVSVPRLNEEVPGGMS